MALVAAGVGVAIVPEGVARANPDVVVEQDPKAVSEGHDPQLEKAVSLALEDLAQHPVPQPERPAYPNYHR